MRSTEIDAAAAAEAEAKRQAAIAAQKEADRAAADAAAAKEIAANENEEVHIAYANNFWQLKLTTYNGLHICIHSMSLFTACICRCMH